MHLTERSKKNLEGVHGDLALLLEAVEFPHPVVVTEGLRTQQRQKKLLAEGKSQTMNSRHLTGHAVDVAIFPDGKVSWDFKLYREFAKAMKRTAAELGIGLTWGGDWSSLKDGTHFQLSWEAYPLTEKPKTVANSKTVAAAAVGIPATAFMADVIDSLGQLIGWLDGVDETIVATIKVAAVVGVVLFIVRERAQKIDREGV
jgi:peptidoglycan L-alanyl-D-glutamate endopeptidase CwlK